MADAGIEYGIALYKLASEEEIKKEVYENLALVSQVFKENPSYLSLLSSPAINKSERYQCIDNAFKNNVHVYVLSFLKTLVENGNVDQFFDATYHYNCLYNEEKRVLNAKVISTIELDDNEKNKIKTMLEEKEKANINIEYVIDKDIIGGIVIEFEDKIIDGSIKKKLQDIKKVLKE